MPTAGSNHLDEKSSSPSVTVPVFPSTFPNPITFRSAPPFVLSHDIPRGILLMVQVTLNYAFMLAVMYAPLVLPADTMAYQYAGRSNWASSSRSSLDWVLGRCYLGGLAASVS